MSADNGIYIAKFPDGYRVIHAQAIENLGYFPEDSNEWEEEIKNYFQNAKLFETEEETNIFACSMSKEYTILEYGVSYIGEFPKTW